MKHTTILSTLSLIALPTFGGVLPTNALPAGVIPAGVIPAKRDGLTDVDIFNFALTLEHLENTFYTQGLSKYSEKDFHKAGLPPWTRGRFEQIAAHEKTHVEFLTSSITAAGAQPVQPCTYNFPDHDVKSFVALAETLESVGTSAYNGAAAFINNKAYLTVAASILSVEARHAAWINSAVLKANPWSTAFETPLDVNQVFTLASLFIVSCPASNPVLPVKAFPFLTIPPSAKPGKKVKLDFKSPGKDDKPLFAAFVVGTGTIFVQIDIATNEVEIPKELIGTVYVVITSDGGKLTDDTTVAGPAILMFPFDSQGKTY